MSAEIALYAGRLPPVALAWLRQLHTRHHAAPAWEQLPAGSRERAEQREILVLALDKLRQQDGLSDFAAAQRLAKALVLRQTSYVALLAARALARAGQTPGWQILLLWLQAWDAAGGHANRTAALRALADKHKGRQRQWQGWEPAALAYWLQPTRPKMSVVAEWLRRDGRASLTEQQVRRFLSALPTTLGKDAPQRAGAHHWRQNRTPYQTRDYSAVPVGFVYEGDGHMCNWYSAHPQSGKPRRLEFTPWMDWRSRYIPGWMLWDRESGMNTLLSLSCAMLAHDHVPAALHIDPGPGFKNRMMGDATAGFFSRFGISPQFALPGNARGKGLIEGYFGHTFNERVAKRFATYCGKDRTDGELRNLVQRVKRGQLALPSYEQSLAVLREEIEAYHHKPQAALRGRTPHDLWQELERVPVVEQAHAVIRPAVRRTVSKNGFLQFMNRRFYSPSLLSRQEQEVILEFSPFDWRVVWVYDLRRRYVCAADLMEAIPAMQPSYMDDLAERRAKSQVKRLQGHADQALLEAGLTRTHADHLAELHTLLPGAAAPAAIGPAPDASADAAADAAIAAFQERLRQQRAAAEPPETNGAA